MLNNEFYPTPTEVIERMLEKAKIERVDSWGYSQDIYKVKTPVLEPHGGAGAILDFLQEECRVNNSDLFTIEIDPDLRYTLQGKRYNVIGTDFLEYDEPIAFKTVIMNPPFSNGSAHVLKGWEVLDEGGMLIAIVNAETILNAYTKERQNLARLIEEYGEFEELGSVFANAERPTDVNIGLITLNKPKTEQKNWFENITFEKDYLEEGKYQEATLAHQDPIRDIVARYNGAVQILKARQENQQRLDSYLQGINEYPLGYKYDSRKALLQEYSFMDQIKILKARFWETIFEKTELAKRSTSDFKKKFDDFARSQASMAFTEEAIKEVLSLFFLNRHEIMKECVINVFDKATSYHEKNSIYTEGWKTNKSYKLSKKIILPRGIGYDDKYSYSKFSYAYYNNDFYNDIDKALCYLNGMNYDNINSTARRIISQIDAINERQVEYNKLFSSTFFDIRIYKKGTTHLIFRDLKHLEALNRFVAENKKWIGADY
jgi:hypothetical protein